MRKKLLTIFLTGMTGTAFLTGCGKQTMGEITPTPILQETGTPSPIEEAEPTESVQVTVTPEAEPTESVQVTVTPEAEPTESVQITVTPEAEPTESVQVTVTPEAEPTESVQPTAAPTVAEDYAETQVTLGQYKGLTLYEVDSMEVAKELVELLESYAELVQVSRPAAEGDTVNINYVGKKDGIAFEGGTDDSEEGYDLVLGSDSFIDGFEDGLIGAVTGEVRDLTLTFPENYHSEELAGQEVVFTVTVNEVLETVVPEASDNFAREQLGYNTWSEYVLDLYAAMNRSSYFEQITESIMASSKVENYPANEIASEKQRIYASYYNTAQYYAPFYGVDVETFLRYFYGFDSLESLEQYAEESAYEVVKNTLILVKIAEVENLAMKNDDYQARLEQYATSYGYDTTEEFIEANGQSQVEKSILLEYVMEYIVSQANIVKAGNDTEIQQGQ